VKSFRNEQFTRSKLAQSASGPSDKILPLAGHQIADWFWPLLTPPVSAVCQTQNTTARGRPPEERFAGGRPRKVEWSDWQTTESGQRTLSQEAFSSIYGSN